VQSLKTKFNLNLSNSLKARTKGCLSSICCSFYTLHGKQAVKPCVPYCNILYNQKDATLHSLFYVETAQHVSTGTPPIIRSANNCIYSIWSLSHSYCYLLLSWKRWNRFECVVDGVSHPQHTQTGSNSSTIAADSSNCVTNTRCCRYSYLRS